MVEQEGWSFLPRWRYGLVEGLLQSRSPGSRYFGLLDFVGGFTMHVSSGKTLVTLATYNELENLPRLVAEIFRYAPDVDLLIVDDNSPDGTGPWCDELAAKDSRVRCLHRTGKLGLGTATVAAMRYAIERGYQYMLNLDADLSHPPRFIPNLREGAERLGVDVMIGSRYAPGGAIEGWPRYRLLMSKTMNFSARHLLGLTPRDCSGSFRCYRVASLARLDFDVIVSHGYAFLEEVLWRMKGLGCRFAETPITFVERQAGHSKINRAEARNAVSVLLRLGWRNLLGKY
jgi:dolichol-phosphate mannosyltransferase